MSQANKSNWLYDQNISYIVSCIFLIFKICNCRCSHVTDIGVGYLSTMTSLLRLFLRWCTQVRDFGLQHMYSMRNLRALSLAGIYNYLSIKKIYISVITMTCRIKYTRRTDTTWTTKYSTSVLLTNNIYRNQFHHLNWHFACIAQHMAIFVYIILTKCVLKIMVNTIDI